MTTHHPHHELDPFQFGLSHQTGLDLEVRKRELEIDTSFELGYQQRTPICSNLTGSYQMVEGWEPLGNTGAQSADDDKGDGDEEDDWYDDQEGDHNGDEEPAERHHAWQVGQSNQLPPNLHIKDYQEYVQFFWS